MPSPTPQIPLKSLTPPWNSSYISYNSTDPLYEAPPHTQRCTTHTNMPSPLPTPNFSYIFYKFTDLYTKFTQTNMPGPPWNSCYISYNLYEARKHRHAKAPPLIPHTIYKARNTDTPRPPYNSSYNIRGSHTNMPGSPLKFIVHFLKFIRSSQTQTRQAPTPSLKYLLHFLQFSRAYLRSCAT